MKNIKIYFLNILCLFPVFMCIAFLGYIFYDKIIDVPHPGETWVFSIDGNPYHPAFIYTNVVLDVKNGYIESVEWHNGKSNIVSERISWFKAGAHRIKTVTEYLKNNPTNNIIMLKESKAIVDERYPAPGFKVLSNGIKFRACYPNSNPCYSVDQDSRSDAIHITWIVYGIKWESEHPSTNVWVEVIK